MHPKKLNNLYFAIILFCAALLLLSIPISRVSDQSPAIPGSNHYQTLHESNFFLDILLEYVPHIILSVSLPIILALGSLILFTMILLRFVQDEVQIYYALIILILTPTFLQTHIGITVYQALLFFTLLFVFLYLQNRKWIYLPLSILFLLNPVYTLLLSAGIVIKSFVEKKRTYAAMYSFFFIGLFFIAVFFMRSSISLSLFRLSVNELFTFFNASYGYSLFLLVLGMGGIFFEKKKSLPLIIIFFSLFYEPLRIPGMVLLSYYCASSFYKLQKREWNINFIGMLTLVLFVSILLFSSSTYIKEQIQDMPREEHVEGLFFLSEIVLDAKILSSEDLSSFVTFVTGSEVISSNNYFYSQNYAFISSEFKENDIGYIFIDEDMKNGGVWDHEEQGLLFLLTYNDDFRKIYEQDGIEIYLFTRWRE